MKYYKKIGGGKYSIPYHIFKFWCSKKQTEFLKKRVTR